jgi:subfamily B ATP-binding cassette protein MsbA
MDAPPPNLTGRFWRDYLRPEWGWLGLGFGLMMIEGSALGALSYLLKPLFDQVFKPGGQDALVWVGGAIFALFAVRAVCVVASRTLMSSIAQRVSARMQSGLLAHILRLDQGFFHTHSPGVLIERVQGDTLAVQGLWTSVVTGVGRDALGLVALLAVALSIDVTWTLAALIGAPLLILPSVLVQRYVRRKSGHIRDQAGQRATRLDEIFHGIQSVKLNRLETYQTQRYGRVLGRIQRAEVKSAAGRNLMPAMIDLITGLGFFAVLWMAGDKIASGARTTGEFMSFFTAMSLTFQPLRRLGELSGTWTVAKASLARIYGLLDRAPLGQRPAISAALPQGAPEIVFDNVVFAHGETPVLRGLSFSAPAGKITAIVGQSGAGKTTLFHLLTGLYDPSAGRILCGGLDTQTISLPDLRGLFASVAQDAALFDETLRDNILLGREENALHLSDALAAAKVDAFLPSLPNGLDTRVGPRGSALSGGQRQRVAIARALYAPAPVLLLDEATSALDAGSETAVTEALTAASTARVGGRTTLVIAHRLATIRHADKIIVLDAGRLAEQGTHDELIAKGGIYAQLCALQFAKEPA